MMKIYFALFAAAALGMAGCASSARNETNAQQEPAFHNTMSFRFAVEQHSNGLYFLVSTAFINKLMEPVPENDIKLSWSELSIYDSKDSLLWQERKNITGKKTETSMPEVAQMTAYDDYQWRPSEALSPPFTGAARIKVYQYGDVKVFDSTISYTYLPPLQPPLLLGTNIDDKGDRQFVINLTVTRVANVANEFLPSSLTHDYKIYDAQGILLWQMSYQKMYMQVVTGVAPKNVGEQTFYTDVWNGEGNIVPGTVPPGEYKLVSIIPCKPEAIEDSVSFQIK